MIPALSRLAACIWDFFRSLARSSAERWRLYGAEYNPAPSTPLLSRTDSEGWEIAI